MMCKECRDRELDVVHEGFMEALMESDLCVAPEVLASVAIAAVHAFLVGIEDMVGDEE